jgi:hypothetical protein
MKTRAGSGRYVILEEISREEAFERLTKMLGGGWHSWLLPYVNFVPINTDRLQANIRLEAEGSAHGRYPCELTVWDVENKRFVLKIMYDDSAYSEYDFSVNWFMGGETFIDLRLVTKGSQGLVDRLLMGKPETMEEKLRRTLSYIPIRGRVDFVKAE